MYTVGSTLVCIYIYTYIYILAWTRQYTLTISSLNRRSGWTFDWLVWTGRFRQSISSCNFVCQFRPTIHQKLSSKLSKLVRHLRGESDDEQIRNCCQIRFEWTLYSENEGELDRISLSDPCATKVMQSWSEIRGNVDLSGPCATKWCRTGQKLKKKSMFLLSFCDH